MAFLNKAMLAKMAGEATAEKHPMLERHDVPRNVKTAYLQGCVLAGVLKDGVLPEAKKTDVLRLGSSLQLTEDEISECISIVTGLATDEAKEQFVGEIFAVLSGDTYPKYFLKDFEALLMEDGQLPGDMADYLDYFGSTLCNDKNWRKVLAEEKQNDIWSKTLEFLRSGSVPEKILFQYTEDRNDGWHRGTIYATDRKEALSALRAQGRNPTAIRQAFLDPHPSYSDPLFQRVREVILNSCGLGSRTIEVEEVVTKAKFKDFGLDVQWLRYNFESEFGLTIPKEYLSTVGKLVDYLRSRGIR